MSSGPQNVTTTSQTNPSPYLTPNIQQLSGLAQSYAGGTNQLFNAGQQALANRGLQGSPLVGQAQSATSSVLSGDLASNPAFGRAANQIQTRVNSMFGSAGRNLEAGAPMATDALSSFGAGLYNNAIGNSIPLANQDYTDINALIDASTLPGSTSANLMSSIAPAAGGTAISSQPVFNNRLGSALGGAATGLGIGQAFGVPGWGVLGGD